MKIRFNKYLLLCVVLIAVVHQIYAQETISRITMKPLKMIYIVDTTLSSDSFSYKMGKGYGMLFTVVAQQQLKPGKVLAIYHTMNPPWIFDIAVEVDKAPGQLTGSVQYKTIEGGDAIVVHYKGPYEQVEKAYRQIEEWLKINNKQRAGPPMEAYLNDPAMVKDKSELLTDVYQLIK